MGSRFRSETGITLLGGGEVSPLALRRALALAPVLVAVDSGADHAIDAGLTPERVVGDLDSISTAARAALGAGRLLHLTDQDDTDFDKALAVVEAPFLLALGFTGARLDHTLAGMSTLVRNPDARLVIDAGVDLCFLAPPEVRLDLAPGTRVSLYPMRPVTCESAGLVWPTDGLRLDPAGRIGTSNAVAEGEVLLRPEAPALLVMAPVATLEAVLAALERAPRWGRED
jgi:thiamine pyrophosphokinase